MRTYEKTFEVQWSHCDPNRHMRHGVFADMATHVRFSFLSESGYGLEEFAKAHFGPVIRKEVTEYIKEVRMGEVLRIDFRQKACSEAGDRFALEHRVFKSNGDLAARLEVIGGWLDLDKRKLTAPPEPLQRAVSSLEKTEDFEVLPPSRRP